MPEYSRPEEEILILCSTRVDISPDIASRIRTLLHKKIDWSYFLQIASQHRLSSFVYVSLKKFFAEDVPSPLLSELREYFETRSRRALSITRELFRLLDLFHQQGISAIPYKGPVLAMALYGDILLRQYCDLDILVHKQDVLKARALLKSEGYKPVLKLSPREEKFLLEHTYEQSFSRNRIYVDIHWGTHRKCFSLSRLNDEKLWENLVTVCFGKRAISTFSTENLFLILCFHGAKHGWNQLNWICDIAQIICQYPQMDWQRVVSKARELKGERMLLIALQLTRDLYTVDLPSEIVEEIERNKRAKSLAVKIEKRLFQKHSAWTRFLDDAIYLQAMQGAGNRIRYCSRYMMPTSAEWDLISLPKPLYGLYYLIRPIRLIGKYARMLLYKFLK